MTPLRENRILVTGGAGFLVRAVCRLLWERSIPEDQIIFLRRHDYELAIETEAARRYADTRPDVVSLFAAEVGGIAANMAQPARFFFANMVIGLHLVEHGRHAGIDKFVHVGTVCAYPKLAPIPFREEDLWNGYPEPTNAPYGIAKRAIFVMLDAYYRQYGPKECGAGVRQHLRARRQLCAGDGHVIPAPIRKCEEARIRGEKELFCWGTGKATRGFLYVDEAAQAIIRAAKRVEEPIPINLGSGEEIAIAVLVNS